MYHNIPQEYDRLEMIAPKSRSFTEEEKYYHFRSALSPFSQQKNRYPDILALEHTRVRLSKQSNQEGSDYINANYILDGKYISCQAPIFSTFSDYWRMIWENSCPIILMLTKLFENGRTKAHIYWPIYDNCTLKFGDISVTKIEEEDYGSHIIRTFQLSKGAEVRTVYHLHHTSWPDFGVPAATDGVRELVNSVNFCQENSRSKGPIVVHCSAGVGRSGTFIAIHWACSLLDRQTSFSILDIVTKLRSERMGMVQNLQQYEFIHLAVQDYKSVSSPSCSPSCNSPSLSLSFRSSSDDSSEEFETSPPNPRANWRKISSDHISC